MPFDAALVSSIVSRGQGGSVRVPGIRRPRTVLALLSFRFRRLGYDCTPCHPLVGGCAFLVQFLTALLIQFA